MTEISNQHYSFETERLSVVSHEDYLHSDCRIANLSKVVFDILTPHVTETLPPSWQNIHSAKDAATWLESIKEESKFHIVLQKETDKIIGFMFIFEPDGNSLPLHIRLGYLIKESEWGNGYASELISGLILKNKQTKRVSNISAGVEADNIGSIKVLENNHFSKKEDKKEGVIFYRYDF